MILDHLDRPDLRRFALANTLCDDLAVRRIWKIFCIRTDGSLDPKIAIERIMALQRVPVRAGYLRRLIIGPCTWKWSEEFLLALDQLWEYTPSLNHIFFNYHDDRRKRQMKGYEAPIFRSLESHGRHLRLETIHSECIMVPDTPIWDLIMSQPSITRIVGIDIIPSRMPPPSTMLQLLPNLRVLICKHYDTAQVLVQSRPIEILSVDSYLGNGEDASRLYQAMKTSTGSLHTVRFLNQNLDFPRVAELVETLQSKSTRDLKIGGWIREQDLALFHSLPSLEIVDCGFKPKHGTYSGPNPNLEPIQSWAELFEQSVRLIWLQIGDKKWYQLRRTQKYAN